MKPAPEALPVVVITATVIAGLLAAPFLLRIRRLLTALRTERDAAVQESARMNARYEALQEETRHLVFTRLPALVAHLAHRHVPVPELAHLVFAGTEVEQTHTAALAQVAQAVVAERHRVGTV
ncbi:hypothetical protein [Streptomyces xantholiticus]|uniref:hypothetical protein n=1 Tax=Streptomyces xantholiticus TaxID=68285 RepID=UPI001671AD0D|nr:hypothetical protein [Streptomyces xantholiticus]GGW30932.1 hypothetical protein GCM10010381_14270 [Streptomyces xantholiticus]